MEPKIGMILVDTHGNESMITAVKKNNNFFAFGRWFPNSYIGYTLRVKE